MDVLYASVLQLCGSEEFWEQAVCRRCSTVSAQVSSLALEVGWRNIFFTSKLQLQKMISRRRLATEDPAEGHVLDPDTKLGKPPGESAETDHTSSSDEESPPVIIPDLSLGTGPEQLLEDCNSSQLNLAIVKG